VPGLSILKLSRYCPWRPRLRSLRHRSSGVGRDLDLLDMGDVDHGPFRHSTQPLTRSFLPPSALASTPAAFGVSCRR